MYRLYQKHLLLNGDIHKEPKMKPLVEEYKKSSAWFYRRVVEWDIDESPFYYVIQDKAITEDDLRSKDRNILRKSRNNLAFNKVELDELIQAGFDLYTKMPAFDDDEVSPQSFRKYLSGRGGIQDYWLVRNEQDQGVGFAVCTVFNESVDLSILRVSREEKSNPVYGLIYEISNFYLRDQDRKYINDGFRSYLHGEGFQDWLIKKLGYRKCYVRIKLYSKIPFKFLKFGLVFFNKNEKVRALREYLNDYLNEQK